MRRIIITIIRHDYKIIKLDIFYHNYLRVKNKIFIRPYADRTYTFRISFILKYKCVVIHCLLAQHCLAKWSIPRLKLLLPFVVECKLCYCDKKMYFVKYSRK